MIRVAAPAGAAAALVLVAIGGLGLAGTGVARAAAEPPDVCLAVASGTLPDGAWDALMHAVVGVASERAALFPDPAFTLVEPDGANQDLATQLHIRADVSDPAPSSQTAGCLDASAPWSIRIARQFLDEGADRMLAAAPTTPGIASSVEVQWFPEEARVLTTLRFAGPLDIPNGRCWIDDALSVDALDGVALSSVGHGLETSPFAESACSRFFDYLVDGGAGEQALRLLPARVTLADGSSLVFVAEDVSVRPDAIVIRGSVAFD